MERYWGILLLGGGGVSLVLAVLVAISAPTVTGAAVVYSGLPGIAVIILGWRTIVAGDANGRDDPAGGYRGEDIVEHVTPSYAPAPPVQGPVRSSIAVMDEVLSILRTRMNRARGWRNIQLALALLCLFAGAGLAGWQILVVAGVGFDTQSAGATIGSALGTTWAYTIIITNILAGMVGFLFFGWFALGSHIHANNLQTVIDLERARMGG